MSTVEVVSELDEQGLRRNVRHLYDGDATVGAIVIDRVGRPWRILRVEQRTDPRHPEDPPWTEATACPC